MDSFPILPILISSKEKLSILISAASSSACRLLLTASVFKPYSFAALAKDSSTFLFTLVDTLLSHTTDDTFLHPFLPASTRIFSSFSRCWTGLLTLSLKNRSPSLSLLPVSSPLHLTPSHSHTCSLSSSFSLKSCPYWGKPASHLLFPPPTPSSQCRSCCHPHTTQEEQRVQKHFVFAIFLEGLNSCSL